ncbi:MAG: RNA polymerase sigma-70 factor (ECF subfamily) [Nitrospinales bacterium]
MEDEIDTVLVKRFQRGDIAAFEKFIQRNQDRLHRLANVYLYENSYCDDAVQEVFIRAYTGLPRFQFWSKPFSWLYRTLKNVCSEINKKQRPTVEKVDYENHYYDESIRLEHKEELGKVFNMLTDLSRGERDVVLLRVFEEFNEKETATILGVKNGTVKSLLHRGLKKLKSRHGAVIEE